MLPWLQHRGFCAFQPRFQPSSREEQDWLLFRFTQTFGQTRSDSRDAKALGQRLPRIRAYFHSLVCCPQARLRTFPGNDILGTRGDGGCWIEIGRQKRRVQVALDGANATQTLMKSLRERFLATDSTSMTPLRQFRAPRGHFDQGAARACNGASQHLNEHPWGTKTHTLAVQFLPTLVRNLFGDDRVAHRDDLVDEASMQTLAMGGEFALFGRFAASRFLVALAVPPVEPLLALLLNATSLIVVLGVGCSPLPLHLPLQAAQFPFVTCQFLAEERKTSIPFVGNERDGRRTQICTNDVASHGMVRLVVGHAFP